MATLVRMCGVMGSILEGEEEAGAELGRRAGVFPPFNELGGNAPPLPNLKIENVA